MGTEPRDTVLFVSLPQAIGGSNRSLVTLLETIEGKVRRVLASPRPGAFADLAAERNAFDEWFDLAKKGRLGRVRRLWDGLQLAVWAFRNRARLAAIHANAITGLNAVALAAIVSRRPVVAWIHDPVSTPWSRRLGPWVRRLIADLRITAVSPTAEAVAVESGLCDRGTAIIVPNPLDPKDVVFTKPEYHEGVTIAVLGGSTNRKGFDLIPAVVREVDDLAVQWRLYIKHAPTPENEDVWAQLDAMGSVSVPGRISDVRQAYAGADIVFVPSREESFCRIAAEAMTNGVPVVASDIPPLRYLLGDGAGLLFPVADVKAAAAALRVFVTDADVRRHAGDIGVERAANFQPDGVAAQMLELYRLPRRSRRTGEVTT
ncbi:MAG: glycosyltransferase family 4 protein [Acidimicrobiia bacterium]